MTRTLVEDLDRLHAGYVAAVNTAVAEDDVVRAEQLASEYDVAAIRLMAEHEGRPDLVQYVLDSRRQTSTSRLRRLLKPRRTAA